MGPHEELEFVRLAGAELDDQAIAEIANLLRASSLGLEATPAQLVRLAASGPLIVARRPCGALPEIIGVAGLTRRHRTAQVDEIIAVDLVHAGPQLEATLRARLRAQSPRPSLFRRRDRAPFGLPQVAAG